jgi:oligoendopeptidase F
MSDVCEPYGGADWVSSKIADPFNYWRQVAISNPVYYISYAVSAAASVEIFAMAEEDQEAAYAAYRTLAEGVTEEDGFLNALKKAGIYTPFEEEAFKLIRATMAK